MNDFIYKFMKKNYTWLSKFLFLFDVMLIMPKEQYVMDHKIQIELNKKSKYFNNNTEEQRYYTINVEQLKNKGEEE